MNSVKLMNEEHKNIKRMLKVVREMSFQVMSGSEVPYDDFSHAIEFVRGYADAHHHGKEEDIFFKHMVDTLGPAATKLVQHGMLVEHDLGRLYMSGLENALKAHKEGDAYAKLDILANAIGYTHLLHRHIDKEDDVVFPFAERGFEEPLQTTIDAQYDAYEKEHENVPKHFITLLNTLEGKYL